MIEIPTIYNFGGGSGGGYKDGGELIDGEFINVENMTFSTYDNTNRDKINFYFDPKSGEILDSVIQVKTAVNSVISVYVYDQNLGIYTPLYYDTNTVSSGNTYNLTIIGNSFVISDPLNTSQNDYVEEINGLLYKCVKIGDKTFMAENYRGSISGATKYETNGDCFYTTNNATNWNFPNNWRLITQYDINYFQSVLGFDYAPKLKSSNTNYSTWNSGANNSTGASIEPNGYYNILSSTVQDLGTYYRSIGLSGSFPIQAQQYFLKDDSNTVGAGSVISTAAYTLRLIKD